LKINLIFYKPVERVSFFCQKTNKRISYQKWKIRTLDDFLRKLRTTGSIERTVVIDFKMCYLYVVLVLQRSVETHLGEVVNFVNCFVEYSFLFPDHWYKKYKNWPRKAKVIIKNKVARFYGSRYTSVIMFFIATEYFLKSQIARFSSSPRNLYRDK